MTKKKPPGTPHGNKGKVRSAETRDRMCAAANKRWEQPEYRDAITKFLRSRPPLTEEQRLRKNASLTGKKKPPFSAEHRQKLREAKLGKPGPWAGIKRGPQSAEWRGNISKGNMGKPAAFPKRRFYYKGMPFRSSWEKFVAMTFDKKGIRWEYEKHQFDLGSMTYRPDFFLPDQQCYWEVKGWFGPKSKTPVELFRKKYPDVPLIVATESVIRMLDQTFNPHKLKEI